MSGQHDTNRLLAYYRQYIGDPDRTVDVYAGFGLFFGGLGLGVIGVVVFLYSSTLPADSLSTYAIREVAAVAAAVGFPALLSGVVVLLPVEKRMLYVAGGGSLVCLAAIGLFVWAYPYNWNVVNQPDYSAQGIAFYSVGIVLVVASTGAALVAHQVERATDTGQANADGAADTAAEQAVTDEQVQADIDRELADAELSWGGVERKETRRLTLNTSEIDDIDREKLMGTATETRTETSTVENAVSELKGLQGGDVETASGDSTDQQASALRALREQQRKEQQEQQAGRFSVLAWLRDLIGLDRR